MSYFSGTIPHYLRSVSLFLWPVFTRTLPHTAEQQEQLAAKHVLVTFAPSS